MCHVRMKKENILFNDKLSTFYLWVETRLWTTQRGNLLFSFLGLLFPSTSEGCFVRTIPQTGEHIPRPLLLQLWSEHWLEREIAQWVHQERDVSYYPPHHLRADALPLSYILLRLSGLKVLIRFEGRKCFI